MDLDPVALGDLLADAGFTREDPVDEHGEFCVRGGIVDWFPAGAEYPIRVEFVGDTVESIRRYDPATQRSIGTLDQASVVPVTEKRGRRHDKIRRGQTPFWRPSSTTSGGRDLTFIVSEEEEVAAHARKLADQISASYEERERRKSCRAPSRSAVSRLGRGRGAPDACHAARSTGDRRRSRPGSRWISESTSPASRPSSSAAAFRNGSPKFAACASAATPSCSSPAPRAAPSAPSSCLPSTTCAAC